MTREHARLIRWWITLSVSALALAGAFAFLAVLTRTPAVQILHTAGALRRAIAGHVTFALLVWLLSFGAVLWLRTFPVTTSALSKYGFASATGGVALLLLAIVLGEGEVILTDYVPVVQDPLFFMGLLALVSGIGLVAGTSVQGRTDRHAPAACGMRSAAAVGALVLAALLVSLMRLRAGSAINTEFGFFQSLFWIPGHLLQFVNVIAMVSAWYLLLESGFGISLQESRLICHTFRGYVVLAILLFLTTLAADLRTFPSEQRLSMAMGVVLTLPTIFHIGIILRILFRGQKRSESPEVAALLFSLTLFMGGILLALVNAGRDSSMWIPAHYHGTLVGGVTMAFMGLTYRILTETGARPWPKMAQFQPWLYGLGMLLVMAGMNWAGLLGAPRKTFDPALGDAASQWITPMNLMGLGGVVAVIGGAAFVINVLWSLWGYQRETVRSAALEPIPESREAL